MTRLSAVLLLLLTCATLVDAQEVDERFPVAGTVNRVSVVLPPREDPQATLAVLGPGTVVEVLGRQGFWYRVVYPSPLGNQFGLMEPQDILIDPRATSGSLRGGAGAVTGRGYVSFGGVAFAEGAGAESSRVVGDLLVRQEVLLRPAHWFHLAAGADLRASSRADVDDRWSLDFEDRGVRRPRLSVRRLSAAFSTRRVSLEVGKQFIRWGRSDIVSPVDRFAPRDFLNVIDADFLPVIGARASARAGDETLEVVWLPRMTPSRLPLIDYRWAVVPPGAAGLTLEDEGTTFPSRPALGMRWSHAARFDVGLSFYDGVNHLPEIAMTPDPERGVVRLARSYPRLRSYGAELALPLPALALKAEAAYFTSPEGTEDEYVLYVVEAERQSGEWLLTAGYAGEVVTQTRGGGLFPAERGLARSIIGRAAYQIDPRRAFDVEGALRQNGDGVFVKGSYTQSFGAHWRLTLAAAGIGGAEDDFLGQYRRNSHATATLRLSY